MLISKLCYSPFNLIEPSRIYGGYREQLGNYSVVVDGFSFHYVGFRSGDQEQFDSVLFTSLPLQLSTGDHQVELINASNDTVRNVLDVNRVGLVALARACPCIAHASHSSCFKVNLPRQHQSLRRTKVVFGVRRTRHIRCGMSLRPDYGRYYSIRARLRYTKTSRPRTTTNALGNMKLSFTVCVVSVPRDSM